MRLTELSPRFGTVAGQGWGSESVPSIPVLWLTCPQCKQHQVMIPFALPNAFNYAWSRSNDNNFETLTVGGTTKTGSIDGRQSAEIKAAVQFRGEPLGCQFHFSIINGEIHFH